MRESYARVEVIARHVRRQLGLSSPLEDLVSYGHEGLLHAARRYDASRGVPFERWASVRIRGAILDGVRSYGNVPRRVYAKLKALQAADAIVEAKIEEEEAAPPPGNATDAKAADEKLSGYLRAMATAMAVQMFASAEGDELDRVGDDLDDSPEALAVRKQEVEDLRATLATLPDAERTLMTQYYLEDRTLEEAGKTLGLSKSWACRLHARAIETLEKRMRQRQR